MKRTCLFARALNAVEWIYSFRTRFSDDSKQIRRQLSNSRESGISYRTRAIRLKRDLFLFNSPPRELLTCKLPEWRHSDTFDAWLLDERVVVDKSLRRGEAFKRHGDCEFRTLVARRNAISRTIHTVSKLLFLFYSVPRRRHRLVSRRFASPFAPIFVSPHEIPANRAPKLSFGLRKYCASWLTDVSRHSANEIYTRDERRRRPRILILHQSNYSISSWLASPLCSGLDFHSKVLKIIGDPLRSNLLDEI